MVWARFSDDWADQPQVITLSASAFRAYVESVLYVSRYATDGVMPRDALRSRDRRTITELVDSGLWQPIVPGQNLYVPHWREHVPARAELDKARDAATQRQKRRRRGEL